jgi:hypothetical protein
MRRREAEVVVNDILNELKLRSPSFDAWYAELVENFDDGHLKTDLVKIVMDEV